MIQLILLLRAAFLLGVATGAAVKLSKKKAKKSGWTPYVSERNVTEEDEYNEILAFLRRQAEKTSVLTEDDVPTEVARVIAEWQKQFIDLHCKLYPNNEVPNFTVCAKRNEEMKKRLGWLD